MADNIAEGEREREVKMAGPIRMTPADTGLLVIDVQEKLVPLIPAPDALVTNIAFLIEGVRIVDMPIQATEQYPKGLGASVAAVAGRIASRPEKVAFSCCAIPSVTDEFRRGGQTQIVLAGIETHVCV